MSQSRRGRTENDGMETAGLTMPQIAPNEMQEIVTAYKDKGDANGIKQVQSNGLHIAGEKFIVLKADERSLYGKKVGAFPSLPPHQHVETKKFLLGP